ncbi:MAG: alpha/beta fold hydrolase [Actinomycetota bacterium]
MTFGLVHGGAHGAWCWERLIPELERRGHRAIAMDLPCEDEGAGAAEYATVVVDALREFEEPVALVGHSLAGLTIPLVAHARPVRRMIFVCGLLPEPGLSFRDQQAAEPDILFPYKGGRAGLRDRFYHHCAPEDADRAMERIRDQALKPYVEVTPLKEWPGVPAGYVLCTEDRASNPAWSRRVVPERLGIRPIELVGSDHSPFLSRTKELACVLEDLATS